MKLKLKNKIEGKEFIEIKNFSWYVFKAYLVILLWELLLLIIIIMILDFF